MSSLGNSFSALEERELLEKTLIIVTSDNGGIPSPQNRAFGHDAVGGLRGSKSFIWEGGHRVPFVVYWKGTVPTGTVRNQLVGTHDIVPTFVELAGGKREADQMLDSVSLAPVLLGKSGDDQPVRQTLLIQSSPGRDAFTEKVPDLPQTDPGATKKKESAESSGGHQPGVEPDSEERGELGKRWHGARLARRLVETCLRYRAQQAGGPLQSRGRSF